MDTALDGAVVGDLWLAGGVVGQGVGAVQGHGHPGEFLETDGSRADRPRYGGEAKAQVAMERME